MDKRVPPLPGKLVVCGCRFPQNVMVSLQTDYEHSRLPFVDTTWVVLKERTMNIQRKLLAIAISGFTCIGHAAQREPPNRDHQEPLMDFPASTMVVPGSIVASNEYLVLESVDGTGKSYSAEYDPSTSTVTAISGGNLIQKKLSAEEMQIANAKAEQAVAAGAGSLALVPIFMGAICYINDQITKHSVIRACAGQGTTPVMEDTGMCGFGASYRCERLQDPPAPKPAPTPVPGPSGSYGGIWASDGRGGYYPIGASDYWSVWTYDDDWF